MAANQPIVITQPKSSGGIGDAIFKLGAVVLIAYGVKKGYEHYQKNKHEDAAGKNPNAQLAIQINQAIDGAGTAEKALYEIAPKITDWKAVSEEYRAIYHTSMLDDIKGDMDPEEFKKFMNLYNLTQTTKDGQPVNSKNEIKAGFLVITEKPAAVRKTPEYIKEVSAVLDPLGVFKSNTIITAPAAKILGVATGRFVNDLKSPDGTRYIEVTMYAVKKAGQATVVPVRLWVASSQVKTVSTATKKLSAYPSTDIITLTEAQGKKGLSGFEGLGAVRTQLITKTDHTKIFNSDGEFHNEVLRPNIILGFKLRTFRNTRDNRVEHVEFITIDGHRRSVRLNQIKQLSETYK